MSNIGDSGACSGAKANRECEALDVLSNERRADGIWLLRLAAPGMAGKVEPGQFAHFRLPRFGGHILRRPFSIYDANAEEGTIELLYQLAGKGTEHMTSLVPGERFDCIGPVGTGWAPPAQARNALLVCGGVGIAAVNMLALALRRSGAAVTCAFGAGNAGKLAGIERLESAGVKMLIATDDGSAGHRGFVTDLMRDALAGDPSIDYIAICGPRPMEAIACRIALESERVASGEVRCEVSMENRMACGIGACLSCVVDTVDGLRRSCADGPVFDARKVVWR
ncbi:MAG: dihydroorotate dehydrogenase electron transfer subunit [bacterium]|nr:dihydroorotate dehydrogenase electron transfer subunit [bacterium]